MNRTGTLSRLRPRVKPNRVSSRPAAPFGLGILASRPLYRVEHTYEDERWLLDQLGASATPEFSGSEGCMSDAEWDELARQREWEQRYEATVAAGNACAMCGGKTAELTGGMCDGCNFTLDADLDIEGGTCPGCGRMCDYLEPSGYCCPCDLQLTDER